jgi:Fic family protein
MGNKTWFTKKDVRTIKYNSHLTLDEVCELIPNINREAIKYKAHRMGINFKRKVLWTNDKTELLINSVEKNPYLSLKELSNIVGISVPNIATKLFELGYKKGFMKS